MRSIILRILSGVICILLLLPLAVSCGNGTPQTEEPEITQSLTLSDTELVLARGGSVTLCATVAPLDDGEETEPQSVTPVWSSSDTLVATVNESGLVTAVGEGYAVISAEYEGAESATCPVMVHSRHIETTQFTLSEDGQSYTLTKYVPDEGTAGIVYTVPSSYEGLPVTAIGRSAFSSCKVLKEVIIPDTVKTVGSAAFSYSSVVSVSLPEGLETIEESAFYSCESLSDINIPDSVSSIGNGAFIRCKGLESIKLPSGLREIPDNMLQDCASLQEISLPSGVVSIGTGAFIGCSSLMTLSLPEGLTSIGDYAFRSCASLERLELPRGLTTIGIALFGECDALESLSVDKSNPIFHSDGGCVIDTANKALVCAAGEFTIPDDGSVTVIGKNAFNNASRSRTSITVPEGVTEIGENAFYCSYLKTVSLPSTLKTIGVGAFYGCFYLEDIVLPEGLERIETDAFMHCNKISDITLPDSLTYIGDKAFFECTAIRKFNIPARVTYIGPGALATLGMVTSLTVDDGNTVYHDYENCIIKTGSKNLVAACITSIIPDDGSVDAIADSAFMGVDRANIYLPRAINYIGKNAFANSSIVSIVLPNDLVRIEDGTFSGCRNLASVRIPSDVYYIGKSAFFGCTSLRSIEIPYRVTELYDYTFSECSSLENVKLSPAIQTLSSHVFFQCYSLESLNIPRDATSAELHYLRHTVPQLKITVDELNKVYREVDGNIIDFTNGTLVWGGPSGVIPENEGITAIGEYAFKGLEALETVVVPEGVVSIGSSAFKDCSALKSVSLPSTLSSIDSSAFQGCSALKSVSLPSTLRSIGSYAFSSCKSLETVALPSTLTLIGEHAFYNCTSLKSLTLSSPSGWSAGGESLDEQYLAVPGFAAVFAREFRRSTAWEKKN